MASDPSVIGRTVPFPDTFRPVSTRPASVAVRVWSATWPKLGAAGIALVVWQAVAWSHWRPDYLLPGPGPVFHRLFEDVQDPTFYSAVARTLERALIGYCLAVLIGSLVGAAVARTRLLRLAFGAMLTGLQSMPSIAWFPLAIILFQLSEGAILFVVVLGAAPAIANGLISGIDHIPPLLLRCGRVLGARGFNLYRHVVLPAALPTFLGGLKQGWAFAWRSLMAGELLVIITGHASLGARLAFAREMADTEELLAAMIVILLIGMAIDGMFSTANRSIKQKWGLADA